eukprot:SAG31_NODE_4136_length_3549_cov_13.673333_5_plen_224_part_00
MGRCARALIMMCTLHMLSSMLLTRMASHKGVVGITVTPTRSSSIVVGDSAAVGWKITGWVLKAVKVSLVDDDKRLVIADRLPVDASGCGSFVWNPSPETEFVPGKRLGTSGHRFKFEVSAVDDDGDASDDAAVEQRAAGLSHRFRFVEAEVEDVIVVEEGKSAPKKGHWAFSPGCKATVLWMCNTAGGHASRFHSARSAQEPEPQINTGTVRTRRWLCSFVCR